MLELYIDRVNSEGQGIARLPDGRIAFVDGALPGETVAVAVRTQKKNYVQARVERVLEPHPQRREPPCRWYRSCGGCQLQHADAELQPLLKSAIAADALRRIGKFDIGEIPCIPSPSEWRYRNKASYPVRARGRKGSVGYYKQNSHDIVPVDHCPILADRANKLYAVLKNMIEQGQFCCYDERAGKGWLRHLVIRSSHGGEQLMLLLVVTAKPQGAALDSLSALYDYLKPQFPELQGVLLNINPEEGNVILGSETLTIAGDPLLTEHLGPYRLDYDASSFFQNNPAQAHQLFTYAAGLVAAGHTLELYCGVGAMTPYLAAKGRVTALETFAPAVELARRNAGTNHLDSVDLLCGNAEDLVTEQILADVDTIVLDPPRGGCDRRLIETIVAGKVAHVVYVSCNPATLARDLALLRDGGYSLNVGTLRAFDMFPQTAHVEVVAEMTRNGSEEHA